MSAYICRSAQSSAARIRDAQADMLIIVLSEHCSHWCCMHSALLVHSSTPLSTR